MRRIAWLACVLSASAELSFDLGNPDIFAGVAQGFREASDEIRLQGWLLDFTTVLDGRTLEDHVVAAVRRGVEVKILWGGYAAVYGATGSASSAFRINAWCWLLQGSPCIARVRRAPSRGSLRLFHQKTFSNGVRCMVSSGDINKHATLFNAVLWLQGGTCSAIDAAFTVTWNEVSRFTLPTRSAVSGNDATSTQLLRVTSDGAEGTFRTAYLGLLRSAERSVWLADQYGMWEEAMAILVDKSRTIPVTIVTNPGFMEVSSLEHGSYHRLKSNPNVTVVLSTCGWMHLKTLIVDNATMITGSTTLEPCALSQNDEMSVRLDEPWLVSSAAARLRRWQTTIASCPSTPQSLLATAVNVAETMDYEGCV